MLTLFELRCSTSALKKKKLGPGERKGDKGWGREDLGVSSRPDDQWAWLHCLSGWSFRVLVHPVLCGWPKLITEKFLKRICFFLFKVKFVFLAKIPSNNSKNWNLAFINLVFLPAKNVCTYEE